MTKRVYVTEMERERLYPSVLLEMELQLMALADSVQPPVWTQLAPTLWAVECEESTDEH